MNTGVREELTEANRRAVALGLRVWQSDGFCFIGPAVGPFRARGYTFDQAFAVLESNRQAQETPAAEPEAEKVFLTALSDPVASGEAEVVQRELFA